MSEDLSVKYYQTNKESLQKKDRERYQCLSKKKRKKVTIWLYTIQKSTRRWKGKTWRV